jgi:hypothetical protein
VIPAVEALAADERGALLGLLVGGAASAADRLSGAAGARCRAALAACAGLEPAARAGLRAQLAAEVGAAMPAGLDGVHPGWLRRVFEREASVVVRAAARGLPSPVARVADELLRARGESGRAAGAIPDGPGLDALRRALFAGLAPPPPVDGTGLPVARALCALARPALLDEVDRRGAETLGLALAGAPGAVVARAAAGVGEPHARVVLEAARAPAPDGAREAARALVASVPPDEAGRGVARAVGLRVVARAVAGEGAAAAAAVAQRLPPALGDALLAFVESLGEPS